MVITVEDVNDNAPEFIDSDSLFGEFVFLDRTRVSHHAVTTKWRNCSPLVHLAQFNSTDCALHLFIFRLCDYFLYLKKKNTGKKENVN